jgi:hypothetical protein
MCIQLITEGKVRLLEDHCGKSKITGRSLLGKVRLSEHYWEKYDFWQNTAEKVILGADGKDQTTDRAPLRQFKINLDIFRVKWKI